MKRIIIPKERIPDINSATDSYAVRFRLITEDRNKLSYWSPIFYINPGLDYIAGEIDISKSGNRVDVLWDLVTILKNGETIGQTRAYDVWVRWSKNNEDGDWIYKERVGSPRADFIIPNTYFINGVDQEQKPNRFTIEVFLTASPISRTNTSLRVYNPPMETI